MSSSYSYNSIESQYCYDHKLEQFTRLLYDSGFNTETSNLDVLSSLGTTKQYTDNYVYHDIKDKAAESSSGATTTGNLQTKGINSTV